MIQVILHSHLNLVALNLGPEEWAAGQPYLEDLQLENVIAAAKNTIIIFIERVVVRLK